jgi:hypothetical protein
MFLFGDDVILHIDQISLSIFLHSERSVGTCGASPFWSMMAVSHFNDHTLADHTSRPFVFLRHAGLYRNAVQSPVLRKQA